MLLGVGTRIAHRTQKTWQLFCQNKAVNRYIASPYILPLLVFVSFFILSLGIGGPAYMSDEIGYLDKAATISGSTVHFTTSWFAGYSFLISPAFFLSSDPYVEWNIILVLNALMWAGSAALLQYVLRSTHPHASKRAIFLATCGAMLYPSWLSMSGYAFATSGFVLFFIAALAALIKSRLTHLGWLSLAGLCAAYTAWIHPLGFLFVGLFALLLTLQAVFKKRWQFLPIAACTAIISLLYLAVVHPWLNKLMSGSIANDSHYTDGTYKVLHAIFTTDYWIQVGTLFLGLVFFVCIATFGIAGFALKTIGKELKDSNRSWKSFVQDPRVVVLLLPILLVIGTIGITAVSWGASGQLRIDQWVYGRYTDMYLLPLIGYGLLATWRFKQAVWIAVTVIIAGIFLTLVTNPENTSFAFNNKVNLQALWPMHLASVLHLNHYWVWGVIGVCGVLVCGLMGDNRRKVYLPLLLIPIILTAGSNYLYNVTITRQHATVSSLYTYIRENYSKTDCIGFTPEVDHNERFNLYSYYLHGYNVKKMSLEQWQKQSCNGPYLTYDAAPAASPSLQISGVETKTNLYMLTRTHYDEPIAQTHEDTAVMSDDELLQNAIIFN